MVANCSRPGTLTPIDVDARPDRNSRDLLLCDIDDLRRPPIRAVAARRVKDRLLILGRSCKSVSRSSHAKGLRRRACAYLWQSSHANPIR
jgi:hypothetical protein